MYRFDTIVKDITKNPTSTRISEKDGKLQIEAIISAGVALTGLVEVFRGEKK